MKIYHVIPRECPSCKKADLYNHDDAYSCLSCGFYRKLVPKIDIFFGEGMFECKKCRYVLEAKDFDEKHDTCQYCWKRVCKKCGIVECKYVPRCESCKALGVTECVTKLDYLCCAPVDICRDCYKAHKDDQVFFKISYGRGMPRPLAQNQQFHPDQGNFLAQENPALNAHPGKKEEDVPGCIMPGWQSAVVTDIVEGEEMSPADLD
jgi:hypothetical protein